MSALRTLLLLLLFAMMGGCTAADLAIGFKAWCRQEDRCTVHEAGQP